MLGPTQVWGDTFGLRIGFSHMEQKQKCLGLMLMKGSTPGGVRRTYAYICIHMIHMYTYVYVCLHMYKYVYICIHMCT